MLAVLGARVLVAGESLQKYHSDIIEVPDRPEPMRHGEVIHAGPDCENLKKGDVTMFHENAGSSLKLDDGQTFIVLHEDDVLAYSPNIMELHMAEDKEVKALREATEALRKENERAEKTLEELKKRGALINQELDNRPLSSSKGGES